MDEYIEAMREDMAKAREALKRELAKIRTGRATPQLVDGIQVNVPSYGTVMPIIQLATIQAPDARLIVITPWDKSTLADIERAVIAADLGLNPNNDGKIIRVPVPALTAERRQQLVKQVRKEGEEAKIRVRHIRREYNDIFRDAEREGDIPEDDMRRFLEKVQELTDAETKAIDDAITAKEKEVLEV